MADNFQITAGSGTTIATKDIGGVQFTKILPCLSDGTVVTDPSKDTDRTSSGSLDCTSTASTVAISVDGMATVVAFMNRSTETGQIEFQASVDGTNYFRLQQLAYISQTGAPYYFNEETSAQPSVATLANKIYVIPCAGYRNIRVKTSVAGTGATLPVVLAASQQASPFIQQIWPGTTPYALGKALNAGSYAANDVGVAFGIVRNDALGTTLIGANGRYGGVAGNSLGQLEAQGGTPTIAIRVQPTVSTSPAYAAGDCVGGKQTLTNAIRVAGNGSILNTINVYDSANQKAAISILFFDADPTAATITDNAAFTISTDTSKLVGKIDIAAADYVTINTRAYACKNALSLGPLLPSSGKNLYAVVVTSGTPTYAATTDLIFTYGFIQG